MIRISRRRFLTLTGGLLATGCTTRTDIGAASTTTGPTGTTPRTAPPVSAPTTGAPAPLPTTVTTIATPPDLVPGNRVLVLVDLAGGNDAVNTLAPGSGSYRDLRPALALPESDLITHTALADHGLHPSLAPLVGHLDAGRLAVLAGVGFPDPDRSHFYSIDRWARADRMDETLGWVGRWLDLLSGTVPALGAVALGGGGATLVGADQHATAIDTADAFAFPGELAHASLRALTTPVVDDPIRAAAQRALVDALGAVEEFDAVADAVRARLGDDGGGVIPAAGSFETGLAVAAQLVVGEVGTRVVSVQGQGFDTHSEQAGPHAGLLADLARGLDGFWSTVAAAGMADRVLVVTHSEFGRRVRENASAGTDHGAAGISFLMGDHVVPGLHGAIDTDDLLDGDLRPLFDPRTLFTACLDWLGGDVEAVLGRRFDEAALLA